MISFRNSVAREAVIELLVHTNPQGLAEGVNPFAHGSSYCTDVVKIQALRQALDHTVLQLLLAAPAETKNSLAPKSGFIPFAG